MLKRTSSLRHMVYLIPICLLVTLALLAACDGDTNGIQGDHELQSLEVYNPATNAWTYLADMPTPRSTATAGVIGGKLYVAGGKDSRAGRGAMNELEIYDPATDTWTEGADMTTRRWGPSSAVVDGELWVIGGSFSTDIVYDVVEIYDPATDSWETGPSLHIPRYRPAVAVMDGKIYVAGGLGEDRYDIANVEYLDPDVGVWLTASSLPEARGQCAIGVIDTVMYVAGGFRWDLTEDPPLKFTLERVDALNAAGQWTEDLAVMLTGRGETVSGVINGKLYVAGGIFDEGEGVTFYDILEVYDPALDSWATMAHMKTMRAEAAAGVIDGKFYVVGGYNR